MLRDAEKGAMEMCIKENVSQDVEVKLLSRYPFQQIRERYASRR